MSEFDLAILGNYKYNVRFLGPHSLGKEDSFIELIGFLYPDFPTQKFIDKLLNITSIKEFQTLVIYPYVQEIVKHTTKGIRIFR